MLLAYAARNPEVAYCQGMNFVAAAVASCRRRRDAFWLLAVIVEEVLVDHYVQSMLGHQVDQQVRDARTAAARGHSTRAPHALHSCFPSQVLEQLAELQLPAVAAHLRGLALSMPFATTQWFLCLFLNAVPPETAFRVWDLILCHHPASLFLAALALLAQCESNSFLEATEVGDAVYLLRSSSRSAFDADGLVAAATAFPVSVDEIERLRREWRRKTMEAMNARLRRARAGRGAGVGLHLGHAQARSLLLALEIDGAAGRAVGEDAAGGAGEGAPSARVCDAARLIRSSARGDANAPALAERRCAARTWRWRSPSCATARRRSGCASVPRR